MTTEAVAVVVAGSASHAGSAVTRLGASPLSTAPDGDTFTTPALLCTGTAKVNHREPRSVQPAGTAPGSLADPGGTAAVPTSAVVSGVGAGMAAGDADKYAAAGATRAAAGGFGAAVVLPGRGRFAAVPGLVAVGIEVGVRFVGVGGAAAVDGVVGAVGAAAAVGAVVVVVAWVEGGMARCTRTCTDTTAWLASTTCQLPGTAVSACR